MNLQKPFGTIARKLKATLLRFRRYLPKQRCSVFSDTTNSENPAISAVYVINLDRQPRRLKEVVEELDCVLDLNGQPLSRRLIRYAAYDGQSELFAPGQSSDIIPYYTLYDQLLVEPQPYAKVEAFDLDRRIAMSRAELAVAASHIEVWRTIADASDEYALILEDDVQVSRTFGRYLESAWRELKSRRQDGEPLFDILYVSYAEVRNGAPKELLSDFLFRPDRGLWYLSGYVLSRRGAKLLLASLPCRGPVDLWVNHIFEKLKVRALRRSLINQRRDLPSTNSYSIIPLLSTLGILNDGDNSLFHKPAIDKPVFVFGGRSSGLTSLAKALSMLGYRCCHDFDAIPDSEFILLKQGARKRVFDAYVNITSLDPHFSMLTEKFPEAKFIVIDGDGICEAVETALQSHAPLTCNLLRSQTQITKWHQLCDFLQVPPPNAPFPRVPDSGARRTLPQSGSAANLTSKRLKFDVSPWIVEQKDWRGILTLSDIKEGKLRKKFDDDFTEPLEVAWHLRTDTFPGNLTLFRKHNISTVAGGGVTFTVKKESLGVRALSGSAITSRGEYLYGRFHAMLQGTSTPGIVTGFFLHRDSPRQEIDVELCGNRTHELLINVYYNPGTVGSKFDYGYRGTPEVIQLGFDASASAHLYTIEWDPSEIRWYVDNRLVHRRPIWSPTPIPDLPMKLHVNTWASRSTELAGRLSTRRLPAVARLQKVKIEEFFTCPDENSEKRAKEQSGLSLAASALGSKATDVY